MNTIKTTLLTNIYNEEYLLPFWLNHHKDMFDDIVIIDYNSTDNSVEICKKICPHCKIIKTRNQFFDTGAIHGEFMDIENGIEGIKIILNTTEFLVCETSVRDIFDVTPMAYQLKVSGPFSKNIYNINNYYELFKNLLNEDILYDNNDRGFRYIHTYSNCNYQAGRHYIHDVSTETDKAHVLWLGFYPMNERLLARKLQIKDKMSQAEFNSMNGFQHKYSRDEMLNHMNYILTSRAKPLNEHNLALYNILNSKYNNKTFIVTGGCGFIGSHMVDKLISLGYKVIVLDNLFSGNIENLNENAIFENIDITNYDLLKDVINKYDNVDGIFHFAALARRQWCIEDPLLCYNINVMGTLNILEIAKVKNIKRVVLSSSNAVYTFLTPYRTSKEALEGLASSYNKMYNMSVITLRYSNVYGKRQNEKGPSPNVFAALRKSKNKNGKLMITGDGTQTRNYTHVSDIVNGNLLAMFNSYCGTIDLCTGKSISLNYVSKFFECPVEYINERPGDVKHIIQCPNNAYNILGWKALVEFEDGIKDVL